jgi:hypothetical protein
VTPDIGSAEPSLAADETVQHTSSSAGLTLWSFVYPWEIGRSRANLGLRSDMQLGDCFLERISLSTLSAKMQQKSDAREQ